MNNKFKDIECFIKQHFPGINKDFKNLGIEKFGITKHTMQGDYYILFGYTNKPPNDLFLDKWKEKMKEYKYCDCYVITLGDKKFIEADKYEIFYFKPDWDVYFLGIAKEVSKRSPDPVKQVGAVIVDNLNRIISTGYNALPSKFPEETIDWTDRDFVHKVIIHAESNALLYCNSKFEGTKLYCTLSPCPECLKLIRASGITRIYFKEKYRRFDEAEKIAELFGIELIQFQKG